MWALFLNDLLPYNAQKGPSIIEEVLYVQIL